MAYIDSVGPADPESVRVRLREAGVDSERADWLVENLWRRSAAGWLLRSGVIAAVMGAWFAYRWWFGLADTKALTIYLLLSVPFILLFASGIEELPVDLFRFARVPRELQQSPRKVSGSTLINRYSLVALAALLFVAIGIDQSHLRDRALLAQRGVETAGQVAGLVKESARLSLFELLLKMLLPKVAVTEQIYHVRYRFGFAAGAITVTESRFNQLRVGDPIPVTYLPTNPNISLPEPKSGLLSRAEFFGHDFEERMISVGFAIVIAAWALFVTIHTPRRLALAESGVATIAVITLVTPFDMQYLFRDQNGSTIHGSYTFRPGGPHAQLSGYLSRLITKRDSNVYKQPQVDWPMVVLYDPKKPKRNIPLGAVGDLRFR